ncbi:MAG: cytochrome b/b6 domain-containing protein [Burkholderiales bacterium]|nr:cytochrome b/b6 domain-containing protein [Burkholderiales bacterium]
MQRIRVWDLPTRFFHWSLVACFITLVVTGNVGGNLMTWHMRAGYAVLVLLAFRLAWGVVGGYWSRFATFVPTPARLWAYLKGTPTPGGALLGHNPLGALSVLAMLGVLGVQVATGLVSDDEIAFSGPLVTFVSSATSGLATTYHKHYGKLLLLGLVVLHICAIVYYQHIKKQRLVQAMLTGDHLLESDAPVMSSADGWIARGMAVVLLCLCTGAAWWLVNLAG